MSENKEDNLVPSILIDKDVLCTTLNLQERQRKKKLYSINNDIFHEVLNLHVPNQYVKFDMYVEKRTNIEANFFVGDLDEEQYCWTPDGSTDDESSQYHSPLNVHIQKLRYGYIINKNVYLDTHQWHTIIFNEIIINCLVCDSYMTRDDIEKHINNPDHKNSLDLYKPLAKFDLSIIREIGDQYHCGVCNTVVNINDVTDHCESQSHEDNLLYSINKVSDVIDVNDNINTNDKISTDYESCDNDSSVNDNDEENYDNEWVIATKNNPQLSYANKTKKLNDAPKHYDIELYNKKIKVTFECWHMIGVTKKNTFYCMACKEFDRLTSKIEHCSDRQHMENLKKCFIVDSFEEYFIRKVGDLYHCGHCNSLQLIENIDDHLEMRHPRKIRKVSENSTKSSVKENNETRVKERHDTQKVDNERKANQRNDTQKNINDDVNENNDKEKSITANAIIVTNRVYEGPQLFDIIVVNYFNTKIAMSFLNYNTVKHFSGTTYSHFYCFLCNFMCKEESIAAHLNTLHHIQLLQNTPFIREFGCHMIRRINQVFHCALCNGVVNVFLIQFHFNDLLHRQLYQTALMINTNATVDININNDTPHTAVNVNNDIKTNDKSLKEEDNEMINDDMINDDMINESLNDSFEHMDLDKYVFIKLGKPFIKLTLLSYNTLVAIGDGNVYCFVCSSKVIFEDIKRHTESRDHKKNLYECKFIESFEGVPLRQVYLTYHCSICNILMSRKQIEEHLSWPKHITETENSTKVSKKLRKIEVKNGTEQIKVSIGKEIDYPHDDEKVAKVLFVVEIVNDDEIADDAVVKKYKMILVNGKVCKVPLNNWHGIAKIKDGVRCIACQNEIDDSEKHIQKEEHKFRVQHPFLKDCPADLFREVNKNTLHCIICNVEVAHLDDVITRHVNGKKHKKSYEALKECSLKNDTYSDCDEDVLQL